MSKMIKVPSPDRLGTYWVNADQVVYVQADFRETGNCLLYFDKEHSLSIGLSAESFAAEVNS